MSQLPDEVFDAAIKAYCHALAGFPSDAVHRDLTTDAAGLRAALAVAFAAGVKSVHTCGNDGDFGAVDNLRRYECTGEDHKLVMLGRCTYRDVEDGTYLSARYPS